MVHLHLTAYQLVYWCSSENYCSFFSSSSQEGGGSRKPRHLWWWSSNQPQEMRIGQNNQVVEPLLLNQSQRLGNLIPQWWYDVCFVEEELVVAVVRMPYCYAVIQLFKVCTRPHILIYWPLFIKVILGLDHDVAILSDISLTQIPLQSWCPMNIIPGLHSNWISDKILAMQRPSSRGIKDNDLLEKFQSAGIKAIFNCTMQGEHPLCG